MVDAQGQILAVRRLTWVSGSFLTKPSITDRKVSNMPTYNANQILKDPENAHFVENLVYDVDRCKRTLEKKIEKTLKVSALKKL